VKLSHEEAKKALLRYLDRKRGPLLVGEAAVTLGPLWSFKETEVVLAELVEEGSLRLAREDEKGDFEVQTAYVRCKKQE